MKKIMLLATLLFATLVNKAEYADPLQTILSQYLVLKDALVDSDAKAASERAGILLKSLQSPDFESLKKDTKAIADAKDINKQRAAFASLSDKLYTLVKKSKPGVTIYYQHCPMYNDGKGGNWLSKDSEIKNPFYGEEMLECGRTVETLKNK